MNRRALTILILLGMSIIVLSIPIFWFSYPLLDDFLISGKAEEEMYVSFLDIGQGDAALIRTPYGQNILVDGGPGSGIIKRLSEELPWWERTIDLMILTHPHDDHVGGLIAVLERYQVERILYTGVSHTGPRYIKWLELIRNKGLDLIIIDQAQTIELGDEIAINIIYPQSSFSGADVEELNNTSIVFVLQYGESKFLFTGDIEKEVEDELIFQDLDLSAQVMKAAHHGSNTSNTEEFIERVMPGYVVVSLEKDNKFNHPSARVIKRFERMGTKIFRTDEVSTVRFRVSKSQIELIN